MDQFLVHPNGIDKSRGLQCGIAWGSAVQCNAMQYNAMQRTAWLQVSRTAVDPCIEPSEGPWSSASYYGCHNADKIDTSCMPHSAVPLQPQCEAVLEHCLVGDML